MTPHTRKYHIFEWLRSKKIGDKFTASEIANDLNTISADVSGILKWQEEYVRKAGIAPGRNVILWQKIADVPEVPA